MDTQKMIAARREHYRDIWLANAVARYAAIDKRYKLALARRDTREASVLEVRRIRAAENLRRLEQQREA